ncbi:hypothetical protein FO440_15975 [Mucilaginibacter corticis]|uniref:Uncharacterized protein n=1 Tax=Mucilaginibacter corticis TaxID=2597670 RepID=A0A556MH66_9SPHI|nr:hypothetical protein [Mucilaginibacter corticis]TSJ39254.1 hypothetical protein FO440_15975 [Mucilaginibacter corticis]
MYEKKSPSLFFTRLVVALLIIVLLSGMTEVAYIAASYKDQNGFKSTGQKATIPHETLHRLK